ncbi:MAG: hypothetical protein ACAH59_01455 [Pseudobdellovibrionaceae bacterium]
MKAALFVLSFVALVITACGKKSGFQANSLPTENAALQDIQPTESAKEPDIKEEENEETLKSENEDAEKSQIPDFEIPEIPEYEVQEKSLIEMGLWVIEKEARKVGAACNFYVQRVLQLMGFGRSSWKANDFDLYVNQNFSTYKVESFVPSSQGSEKSRLKKYLWSFPEKTGVILQWKRRVGPGHVAILHRQGNQLVIFHASLNRFVAKAQKIDMDVLFYQGGNAYRLNVFSDLKN